MGEIIAKKDIKKGEVMGKYHAHQLPPIVEFDKDKIEFKEKKVPPEPDMRIKGRLGRP